MASKVYTKKGDQGYTLVMGTRTRFPKCHPRIEAVGSIDELNCYVGMVRSYIEIDTPLDNVLNRIQNDLFTIGAKLADVSDDKIGVTPINIDVNVLETSMDGMSKTIQPLKNFILPTGNQVICYCHLSRTVCRRAERNLVRLSELEESGVDKHILSYINRLSDYFFVLARYLGSEFDIPETIWKKE